MSTHLEELIGERNAWWRERVRSGKETCNSRMTRRRTICDCGNVTRYMIMHRCLGRCLRTRNADLSQSNNSRPWCWRKIRLTAKKRVLIARVINHPWGPALTRSLSKITWQPEPQCCIHVLNASLQLMFALRLFCVLMHIQLVLTTMLMQQQQQQ